MMPNECSSIAPAIAEAINQVFDLGGDMALIYIVVGFILGGGLNRVFGWLFHRVEPA